MESTDVYDVLEAARMLRVSNQMIYKLIREGKLNAVPVGRYYRITGADIAQYMEDSRARLKERIAKREAAKTP